MNLLLDAMRDPDRWVVRIRYTDSKGKVTIRVVSPICLIKDSILVLCLAREEPRRLKVNQISDVELVAASDVLMPVPIVTLNG